MKQIYKYLLLEIMIIFAGQFMAKPIPNDLSKLITETYSINDQMYVEISNQYGDVEVIAWDKDSVKFEVNVIVRSERDIDLDEIMDRINIDFKANSTYILVQTEWADDVNFFRKSMQNLKQGLGSNGNVEVNYIVHLPSKTKLDINNKFGNVFMGDHHGDLNLNIEYGDLRARNLMGVKKIGLKYGKLKVSKMDRGLLELSAVKSASIIEANDIMITASSSEIEVDQVNILNISSKHDDIRIETVNELYGNMSLSDLKVILIKNESRLQSKFGSIYFKEIEPNATKINIEGDKTDIFLNFDSTFDGLFDIQVDEEKKLALAEYLTVSSREKMDNSLWNVRARQGDGKGTAVSIVSERGFVQIGK